MPPHAAAIDEKTLRKILRILTDNATILLLLGLH